MTVIKFSVKWKVNNYLKLENKNVKNPQHANRCQEVLMKFERQSAGQNVGGRGHRIN